MKNNKMLNREELFISDSLHEASGLTPAQKMDDWHFGRRNENIKACGDAKLKLYHDICVKKGYSTEAGLINVEAQKRGLSWAVAGSTPTTTNTNTGTTAQTQQNKPVYIINVTDDDFHLADAQFVKDNASTPELVIDSAMAITGTVKQILIDLIFALTLKLDQASEAFKNFLLNNVAFTVSELQESINKVIADKNIIARIKTIINEIRQQDSLSEKFNPEDYKLRLSDEMDIYDEKSGEVVGYVRDDGHYDYYPEYQKYFATAIYEAVEKHDELNPKLWNSDNTLKAEVKEKVNAIVNEFLENLKQDAIKINVKDVILVGSNCAYNYNSKSDLDIHIYADTESLQCPDNLYPLLYGAYRSLFNKNLDIDFYGIPVELYVETDADPVVSNGIYSIMEDKWIKEPVKEDVPEIDQEAFKKELKIWEDEYKNLLNDSKDVINETLTESAKEDLLKARSIIADQIRGEWDADKGYTKAAADLAELKDIDTEEAQKMMLDIASEEHVHVGELETAYSAFDSNLFNELENGHNEAEEKAEPANELDYDQDKIDASLKEAKHIDGKFDNRNIEYKRSPAGLGKRYKPALIKLFNDPDTRLEIQLFKELKINPVATLRDLLLDRLVLHHLNQDHFDYGSYNEFITSREMHDKLSRLPKVTDKRINNRTDYIEALKAGYEEAFKSGLVLFKLSDLLDAENGVVPTPIKTYDAIKHDLEDHIPEDWFDDWRDEAAMSNIAHENESLCESVESDKIEQIEDYLNRLYALRKQSIAKDGEFGIGNLVFKELRNKGYLDNLKEMKNQLLSKDLSLEEAINGYLTNQEIYKYRAELSRTAHDQVIVQQNGLFNIYLVKENEVNTIVNKLRALDFVESVSSFATGKYDFNHIDPLMKMPAKYFEIRGKIKV